MSNAKQELLNHIKDRKVRCVHVYFGNVWGDPDQTKTGTLEEVLPFLDREYDNGYGGQVLFGNVWYEDGTWSVRGEYDGSEWWEHQKCPDLPVGFERSK